MNNCDHDYVPADDLPEGQVFGRLVKSMALTKNRYYVILIIHIVDFNCAYILNL